MNKPFGFRTSFEDNQISIFFSLRGERDYVQAGDFTEAVANLWPTNKLKIKFIKPLSQSIQFLDSKPNEYEAQITKTDQLDGKKIYYVISSSQIYPATRIHETRAPKYVLKFFGMTVFLFLPYSSIGDKLRSIFEYVQRYENMKYVVRRIDIAPNKGRFPLILFMKRYKKQTILEVEFYNFSKPILYILGQERRANFPHKD